MNTLKKVRIQIKADFQIVNKVVLKETRVTLNQSCTKSPF